MQRSSRWEMNRKDNMYLEQVLVNIANNCKNTWEVKGCLKKWPKFCPGTGSHLWLESRGNDMCSWRFLFQFFGQEINIDKSHVAHIPMSELRQLKMMCGVTSNWKRLPFPDRRGECKFFISLISKPSLINIRGQVFWSVWKSNMGGIRKNFGQWLLAGLEIVSLAWPQCRCRPKSGWRPSPQLCSLPKRSVPQFEMQLAKMFTRWGGRGVTHRHRQMQEGICSCSCVHNIDKQNANTFDTGEPTL